MNLTSEQIEQHMMRLVFERAGEGLAPYCAVALLPGPAPAGDPSRYAFAESLARDIKDALGYDWSAVWSSSGGASCQIQLGTESESESSPLGWDLAQSRLAELLAGRGVRCAWIDSQCGYLESIDAALALSEEKDLHESLAAGSPQKPMRM